MKNLNTFRLALAAIFVTLFPSGCSYTPEPIQTRSFGSPGDLLVVVDTPQSQLGAVKTSAWFGDDFPALPQSEKLFRVSSIPASMFDGHWRKARNIVVFKHDANRAEASLTYSRNQWAENQQVVEVLFPDSVKLREMMEQELPRIKRRFYNADVAGLTQMNRNAVNDHLVKKVLANHGVNLAIPQGFTLKKDTTGFTWMEYDTPKSTIGILVYSADKDSLQNAEKFAEWRNEKLGFRVPGEREGSRMVTEEEMPLLTQRIRIGGVEFTETRGLWKMKNDFMGGPFVNLMGINGNKAVVIEGFVYAPGHNHKAVLVRSVDAVIRSVSL